LYPQTINIIAVQKGRVCSRTYLFGWPVEANWQLSQVLYPNSPPSSPHSHFSVFAPCTYARNQNNFNDHLPIIKCLQVTVTVKLFVDLMTLFLWCITMPVYPELIFLLFWFIILNFALLKCVKFHRPTVGQSNRFHVKNKTSCQTVQVAMQLHTLLCGYYLTGEQGACTENLWIAINIKLNSVSNRLANKYWILLGGVNKPSFFFRTAPGNLASWCNKTNNKECTRKSYWLWLW